MVVVEGVEMMALMDTGSQVSTLTEGFCSEFRLRILPLGVCSILRAQGYCDTIKGICRGNLIIPGLPQYNEDVLFFVILDTKYGERVPLQKGTPVIDHLVMTMNAQELQQAGYTWKQVHLSTLFIGKVA